MAQSITELILRFKGDDKDLKSTMARVRSELTQVEQAQSGANKSELQRSSVLISQWKQQEKAAAQEAAARTRAASQTARTIEQEEKQLAATMIREARATQAARLQAESGRARSASQAARAIEQEEKQLSATVIREARAVQAARAQAEAGRVRTATQNARAIEQEEKRLAATMSREARAAASARIQAERQAITAIKGLERERQQVAAQSSKAIAAQAKSEADARIREGRRASIALIAQLKDQLREQAAQTAQASKTRAGVGTGFLAGAAGGVTALLGISAVNEIRQAASAWVDYAAKLETTKIAFTTMLGSAEAAQAHLNELQAFALKTPFQFADLIDASQRMQALGFNAEQVVPILTDVGNAVAAAGGGSVRLDRVVLALSQMQSKGRVATQELNQLAESGISGFKILELQTGKSRAELVKMVEAGQISAAVFLEAFQKFSQQNFGGLMEQQSKTFTGAMSNIKDALLQTSSTAFQPLYDRLTELALRMSEVSTKSQEFRANMETVGRQLARIWDGAVEAIHIVQDAYRLVIATIIGIVGGAIHSQFALRHAIHSVLLALKAQAAFMSGDVVGAMIAMERSEEQATRAVLEARDAAFAATAAFREMGDIMDRAGDRSLVAANKIADAAALIRGIVQSTTEFGQIAVTVGRKLEVGGDLSTGIRPPPVSIGTTGAGKGRSQQDEAFRAELEASTAAAAKELEQQRHIGELLKQTFDENRATLEEFYKGRQTLIDEHFNTLITQINAEQSALDNARARGRIKASEAQKKDEELTKRTTEAQNKLDEESRRTKFERQRALDKAALDLERQLAVIRENARENELTRIQDLLDRQLILESDVIARRLAVEKEAQADRILLLDLELKQITTSAERKIALDNEKILSEQKFADATRRLTQQRLNVADDEQIKRIEDRIEQRIIKESEGEKQIAAVIAQGLERRKQALEDESAAYTTSLERRTAITDELILLDKKRVVSAEEAARRIAKAQFDEQNAPAQGATRPRVVGAPPTDVFLELGTVVSDTMGLGAEQAQAFGEIITSTFGQIAGAVGEAVKAFVLFGSVQGGFKKFAAEVIASIAQMAAVQAVFELAQGLAMLALGYFFPNVKYFQSAGAHFAAAAMFGAIAVGAAGVGRAVAGNSFNKTAEGGAGGGNAGEAGKEPLAPRRIDQPRDVGRSQAVTPSINLNVIVTRDEGSTVRAVIDNFRSNGLVRQLVQEEVAG